MRTTPSSLVSEWCTDVVNVCAWFRRKGLDVDHEEVFADLLSLL